MTGLITPGDDWSSETEHHFNGCQSVCVDMSGNWSKQAVSQLIAAGHTQT